MRNEVLKEGQRWISESEPELGLGTIVQLQSGRVSLLFPGTGELRQYASDNAPLKRVRFRAGDRITTHEDEILVVDSVTETDGLITYHAENQSIPEAQLNDRIRFSRPEDRFLNAHCDEPATFQLRWDCAQLRHRRQQSPTRGFVGGRVDLIPHQLYIAHELSTRYAPRVLLSDEVGLGKTIEACLILHRLLVSNRAERVLIVVPESLVHQWFVELLRKFNLWVNIFDEDRCQSIEANQTDANPFLDDQLILCSIGLVSGSEKRRRQAVEAGWDLLIVDEAHHLEWSEAAPSPEYLAVESLAQHTEGLLLLTATPEQLGPESHFARLRLLDPERYASYAQFVDQSAHYHETANLAETLIEGDKLSPDQQALLETRLGRTIDTKGSKEWRNAALQDLLDFHGPGRVIFRNTRHTIQGFPKRCAHLVTLRASKDHDQWVDQVATEFAGDAGDTHLQSQLRLNQDPRIRWLANLAKRTAPEKILVICRTKEKAQAIDDALREQINAKTGVFHEDLPLVQRDRNAAWFADEEGAQLLLCSEIGSEGRNFQFAHHLVLFDLPLNPELVEQRIGRLDRIGQTEDIQIYLPYLDHSPQEVVSQWYHEGLDALETNLEGGQSLFQQFGQRLHDFALEYPALSKDEAAAELETLINETRKERQALVERLKQGRDRLLELSSYRAEPARAVIDAICQDDEDTHLESFINRVFDHYGVHVDELAPRTYRLDPSGVITDAFPAIPKEGLIATFDRQRALSREDVAFMTWDHPIVAGAIDLILSSELGNSCFAVWQTDSPGLLIDTSFELSTVAPGKWHVHRFLPATPIRIVLDHRANTIPIDSLPAPHDRNLVNAPPYQLLDDDTFKTDLLPKLLEAAESEAKRQAEAIRTASLQRMNQALEQEHQRLETLQKINDHIRPAELEFVRTQQSQLSQAIEEASVRLDAIRVIWKTA